MEFWRRNMPAGMLLRSSIDWHLDPQGRHTLAAYLEETDVRPSDVDPIPLELFIDLEGPLVRFLSTIDGVEAPVEATGRRRGKALVLPRASPGTKGGRPQRSRAVRARV